MKIREISLIIIAFLVQCCGIFPSQKSFIIKNQYGRIQLKEMKFKESFDKSKIDLVDLNVIYYYHRENTNINMEFNFIIRFFKNGQYAFFTNNKEPITHLSYEDINYNDLQKASYVGYYNIKGNTIKIYYKNHEKEIIATEDINYVRFFALRRGKRGKERKPSLQLFDSEERILTEMTIEIIDYFRLIKYLKKYNVTIVDDYSWN